VHLLGVVWSRHGLGWARSGLKFWAELELTCACAGHGLVMCWSGHGLGWA
jgi:hypothetical protein